MAKDDQSGTWESRSNGHQKKSSRTSAETTTATQAGWLSDAAEVVKSLGIMAGYIAKQLQTLRQTCRRLAAKKLFGHWSKAIVELAPASLKDRRFKDEPGPKIHV